MLDRVFRKALSERCPGGRAGKLAESGEGASERRDAHLLMADIKKGGAEQSILIRKLGTAIDNGRLSRRPRGKLLSWIGILVDHGDSYFKFDDRASSCPRGAMLRLPED